MICAFVYRSDRDISAYLARPIVNYSVNFHIIFFFLVEIIIECYSFVFPRACFNRVEVKSGMRQVKSKVDKYDQIYVFHQRLEVQSE